MFCLLSWLCSSFQRCPAATRLILFHLPCASNLPASSHTLPSVPEMECSHSTAVHLRNPRLEQSLSGRPQARALLIPVPCPSPSWGTGSRGRRRCSYSIESSIFTTQESNGNLHTDSSRSCYTAQSPSF